MLRKIASALTGRQKPKRPYAITNPAERRRSWLYFQFIDHGFLRYLWTNFDEIAPGVFRSNHPHPARLAAYRARGILGVLNLRGVTKHPPYLIEEEACAKLGLTLVSVAFAARAAPRVERLQELFDAFDTIPRPFVIHCKSGADRAGMVSALYMLDQGAPLKEARKHLSLRYLHLKFTKTGIQDAFLDLYETRLEQGPISLRHWALTEYKPEDLRRLFATRRTLAV